MLYDRVSKGNENIDQYVSESSNTDGNVLDANEEAEDEAIGGSDLDEGDEELTEDATAEQEKNSDNGFPFWLFIVIPIVLLLFFGTIVIVVGIFIYRAYKKKQNQQQ